MTSLADNSKPISKNDLIDEFQKFGIGDSANLMIHSSLKSIGWVIGGASTVVESLLEIVGENGTIVMPAATPYSGHPDAWEMNNIPKHWHPKIIKNLPVFNKDTTPTSMGLIPETFRNWPKTERSNHPISSVCARGKLAEEIVRTHNLELSEGANTPYEKIYQQEFKVLLLGVGFNRCTMLHYAESKSENRRTSISRYPVMSETGKEWVEVLDMANDNSLYFPRIGQEYINLGNSIIGSIGNAKSILFPVKELVNFATEYFNKM